MTSSHGTGSLDEAGREKKIEVSTQLLIINEVLVVAVPKYIVHCHAPFLCKYP